MFAKPDTGVGASDTFKITGEEGLKRFFEVKPDAQYVMEEFVVGDVYSYDAISDSQGNILFESAFKCPNVADSVNLDQQVLYYVMPDVPDQLREYGRRIVMDGRMPDVFAAAMGNQMYVALCDSMEDIREIGEYILDDISYLL